MAHYIAEIDSNAVVLRVIVAASTEWAANKFGGTWIACDDTRYPGPGWTWSEQEDTFIPPQPYPSWTWDGEQWQPPILMPEEGFWLWDEEKQQWVEGDA